ncbi:tRNA threonylcarbamoyladenosine biosynthesis protein TsaB [Paramagnetospirillum marisnigri]|uniref:tRNA threonylcarbamoyladenosine biosynthesis protein TsaB n=1 Tax=Paramagnetospirillum marisnigri TaxID=1285242 RepID=A0A178MVV9_9PROT|nr:tRNA (adenosine(37)-N6)-threonylcarbamoyltransferase complex dimerization subunit type 1 TsaB [Paramagnetospirillum marisnigri]OAN54611.1 tRNA threonylcarbamoyladenosine biosynthesis protein TsaB [Paramagnetospirillum marisnigri]
MIVLAIDSSTSACSAALWRDGTVLACRLRAMARGQSEALLPMVAEIMAETGLDFAGLDLLAVTVGPGAFTGLRIGLAAARGLALAAGLPLAGVSTPLAVAAAVPEAERQGRTLLAAVESRRDECWVQAFASDLTPLGEVTALLPAQAAGLVSGPVVVAGDRTADLLPHLSDAVAASSPGYPDAAVVAALAARLWREGRALPPEPLYLRAPDVTL